MRQSVPVNVYAIDLFRFLKICKCDVTFSSIAEQSRGLELGIQRLLRWRGNRWRRFRYSRSYRLLEANYGALLMDVAGDEEENRE